MFGKCALDRFLRRSDSHGRLRASVFPPLRVSRRRSTLGFVTRVPGIPERILVETGRPKYDGLKDRDYFYIMLNIDSYPDFDPKAKELASKSLRAASDLQKTRQFKSDPDQNFYELFPYSPSAFEARLHQIYEYWSVKETLPAENWTRAAVLARMLQLAPFNQLDGAWLRYGTNAGPVADINSLLFEIWSDETGNGDPALNHANLYTALLQSVGIYLPDIRSRAYADNAALFDSAFTNSLFQLCISQYSDSFFPEILGMTLNLEWEVLSLWSLSALRRITLVRNSIGCILELTTRSMVMEPKQRKLFSNISIIFEKRAGLTKLPASGNAFGRPTLPLQRRAMSVTSWQCNATIHRP